MGDMKETFEGYKELRRKRVAKNPDRIAYAIKQFEKHRIAYTLFNDANGHFHCRRKTDGRRIEFWAGTGKIRGYVNLRGIRNLIRLCEGENLKDTIRIK